MATLRLSHEQNKFAYYAIAEQGIQKVNQPLYARSLILTLCMTCQLTLGDISDVADKGR